MTAPYDYNRDCDCVSVDRKVLEAELERGGLDTETISKLGNLFASVSVLVTPEQLEHMRQVVRDVTELAAMPGFAELVLGEAPATARHDPGNHGVFYGYDFHLGPKPQLIEINTNAGGALLNVFLARAQRACSPEAIEAQIDAPGLERAEQTFLEMFQREWREARAGGAAPLRRVAIVDDTPREQFLFPEFVAFARLFERAGIAAEIADPRDLVRGAGGLTLRGERVDLIYNRLTDFYLEAPEHAALREAYLTNEVVLTPHPRSHALFAHKRNLVRLTDDALLASLGAAEPLRRRLAQAIPKTIVVHKTDGEALWRGRKRWFFKPTSGYGSKAAYRGDKLTKGTFAELLEREYVAQETVLPSERTVTVDGRRTCFKIDVRAFAYHSDVQLFASRLYVGQTTNFRTPGSGFAPVFTRM